MNRVAITGIGVESPVGTGRQAFWEGLASGRSGLGPITLFDVSEFPVRIGAEVNDLDVSAVTRAFPEAAGLRDRKVFLALQAAQEALCDAALAETELQGALLQVGVGLETLCLEDLTPFAGDEDVCRAIARDLPERLDGRLLQVPLDVTAEILGHRYGFLGGRYTNCSACAAGAQVVGEAWRLIRQGASPIALVGATDSMLNPLGLGGFSLLREA